MIPTPYLFGMSRPFSIGMDLLAVAAVGGAWLQLLPGIAAVLAAIWYAVQIWESKTGQAAEKGIRIWLVKLITRHSG